MHINNNDACTVFIHEIHAVIKKNLKIYSNIACPNPSIKTRNNHIFKYN